MNRTLCLSILVSAFLLPSTGSAHAQEPKKTLGVSTQAPAAPKNGGISTQPPVKKPKSRKKSKPVVKKVDINNASKEELKTLPGITDEYAARIIAGRPYRSKAALAVDGRVPATVYFLIKDRVEAGVPDQKK